MKKIILSLIAAIFLLTAVSPQKAYAQWYNQDPVEWYNHVYDNSNPTEIFGERYTAAQVDWIIMSFLTWPITKFTGPDATACLINGIFGDGDLDATPCVEGMGQVADAIGKFLQAGEGVTDQVGQSQGDVKEIISFLVQDRPVSAISYVKQIPHKINPIKTANAQSPGFGYSRLEGRVQELWAAMRDAAYSIFVAMSIVLAFMVMFRVKTSPQMVVTVQSALPKLAVSLVLVTFSFAIAGLLIDLMYVVIGIISLILGGVIPHPGASMFYILTHGYGGAGFLPMILFDLIGYPMALLLGMMALIGSSSALVNLVGAVILAAIGAIMALILLIVMFIVLIFIWLKISWLLIRTTAVVFLLVIFAPIQITLGVAVQGIGFGAWLKNLAANLAVYPTVGLLFSLSFLFLNESFNESLSTMQATWARPILNSLGISAGGGQVGIVFGDGWPPLLAGAGHPGPLILMGVSLVILFIIPKTADLIKSLMSGKPFGYGMAVGEAFGPAKQIGAGSASAGFNIYEQGRQVKQQGYKSPVAQAGRTLGWFK